MAQYAGYLRGAYCRDQRSWHCTDGGDGGGGMAGRWERGLGEWDLMGTYY